MKSKTGADPRVIAAAKLGIEIMLTLPDPNSSANMLVKMFVVLINNDNVEHNEATIRGFMKEMTEAVLHDWSVLSGKALAQ